MTRQLLAGMLSCALALPMLMLPVGSSQAGWFRSDREALACDDAQVLRRVSAKFRHQAREVHHEKTLAIETYDRVHEHRYHEETGKRPIARRYCGATVRLSDGRARTIWYLIERGAGFASIGDNVEFCVSGFDRWNVYNNACRILR